MCWKCKINTVDVNSISRSTECPVCHSDLHCCKNCSFYEVGSHYDCHETIDELVKDKEKANFCDFFKAKVYGSSSANSNSASDKAQDARDAFSKLFGV